MYPIDYFDGMSEEDQGFEYNPVIFFMTTGILTKYGIRIIRNGVVISGSRAG
jgi:hypothetical protein